MTDGTITTSPCRTPGCANKVPHPGHAYCSDCVGTVLRTGRPPELLPTGRPRIDDVGKHLTGSVRVAA